MPFRMICVHPFALAAITVVAIGVITYQILSNRRRVPARGRIPYRGNNFGSYGPDESDKPDKPDEFPKGFSTNIGDNNGTVKACNSSDSEKQSNDFSGLRRRTVDTQSPEDVSKIENLNINCSENKNHPHSISKSFDGNSDSSSDCHDQNRYTAQQNNDIQKISNSISQVNPEKTFVANINDEDSDSESDSDSSESNNSLDSVQNDSRSIDLNESICSKGNSSTTGYDNIRFPSPIDNEEEIYKRDVCNNLKTDIDRKNCKEKCFEDCSDEDSDISESNFSLISDDASTSSTFMKKPMICKGCLEEFANAVAHPCKHCYLCLDCAIKVHRIYKKCTICLTVIKTFEQLTM